MNHHFKRWLPGKKLAVAISLFILPSFFLLNQLLNNHSPTVQLGWSRATASEPRSPIRKTSRSRTTHSDESASNPALALAEIPRHYSHIRLAALAYDGNPMGTFEDRLLKESVDLVVPHRTFLKHISTLAPETPQLLYTNTSNLYGYLYLDWLKYADKNGFDREWAFYHAAKATRFRGSSPSSRPVAWFWRVYRGRQMLMDVTAAACKQTPGGLTFGALNEAVYLGYPERFREINLKLASGARANWSAVPEYPSEFDSNGRPTKWTILGTVTDTTQLLTRSGQITFDPPADWQAAPINGTEPLYYVRWRTTSRGTAPLVTSLLGRDYVEANASNSGTIPAFDAEADINQDGYLDDQEYAKRAAGKNARFVYESRLFAGSYGQMRFAANLSSDSYRRWAVHYHANYLDNHSLAGGLFMDNAWGKAPINDAEALEPVDTYAVDAGKTMSAISSEIAPRCILMNTSGEGGRVDPLINANPFYFEEFAIRPLAHFYVQFEELAASVARRQALTTPAPYGVLDSYPSGGSPTDPRTQIATLAYYYLLADPNATFLMLFGGYEPSSTWTRHWAPAVAFDVGKPTGKWSRLTDGKDPANPSLQYRVYQRPYEKALVLYKPLSFGGWSGPKATLGDETATRHDLQGTYRPLRADGTLGDPLTRIDLRNGEGAILVKVKP